MLYASPDYTSPVRCGTCLPPPTLTPCGTEYDASRTPPTRRPPCARKHKFIILAASKDVCEGRERSMCLSTTVPQSSSVCGRYCQELLVGARGVFPQCLSNVWQKTPSDAQYRTCVNIFIKPSLSPAITSLKYLARYRQESGHAVISVLASSGGVFPLSARLELNQRTFIQLTINIVATPLLHSRPKDYLYISIGCGHRRLRGGSKCTAVPPKKARP